MLSRGPSQSSFTNLFVHVVDTVAANTLTFCTITVTSQDCRYPLSSKQPDVILLRRSQRVMTEKVRYPERCCCLAACAHQCLRLFQRLSPSGPAVLQVLAGVQAVGICCCMDPRSVIGPMLQAFQAPGLRSYQSHVLSVLSRLVLEQLGGGQPSEKATLASCNICTLDSSQLPGLEETLHSYGPKKESNLSASPSPSYRSQGILPVEELKTCYGSGML